MDSEDLTTFSPSALGSALILSLVLFLALPCVAGGVYCLLMLLSYIVPYLRTVLEYCFFVPLQLVVSTSVGSFSYLFKLLNYWAILVILILLGIIGTIVQACPGLAIICDILFRLWSLIGILCFVLWATGLSNDNAYMIGNTLKSWANKSWASIFGVFYAYRIYIYSWTPVVLVLLPTMLKIWIYLMYWFIAFVLAAAYKILSAILLGITLIFDWMFSKRNYRYICPADGCGFIGKSSDYQCPHCKKTLTNLKPSREGIFFRRCPHCNKRVGLSSLTGRNKYTKVCPVCHKTWDNAGLGEMPASVYVIEGASISGKTSFLLQMLAHWSSSSNEVKFAIDQQGSAIALLIPQIDSKELSYAPQKDTQLSVYIMKVKKRFRSHLAYFYDADETPYLQAGMTEPYFNLANGIFLIIDPWAENSLLNTFGENSPQTNQDSKQDVDAIIGRLCSRLEHASAQSGNSRFNVPICIVVTKYVVAGLGKRTGNKNGFSKSINEWEEHSRRVENFLTDNGMYNFVNIVKTRFKKNAFIAVGPIDDFNSDFHSVLNPLLWMINNAR